MNNDKKKWVMVRIPTDSVTYTEINNKNNTAAWKIIEQAIKNQPKTKDEKVYELYENFISDINKIYPSRGTKLVNLSPLIMKILWKQNKTLDDDAYFELLKKLCEE